MNVKNGLYLYDNIHFMKFSLLIANYNNGKFFPDCYQSILSQTFSNWEAVILDDCSEDDSENIIKKIIEDDPRFRYYKNDQNKGVGFTKNKLIELAQGELCGYIDPDDALLPDALQAAANIFQKKKKVVLTYSRHISCDENLQPKNIFKSARQVPNGDPRFFNCPNQINHFVAFRKSVYFQCEKMDENLRIAEDQDLYLKMYEKGDVHFIDQTDYLYRSHAGGISQNENKASSYEYFAQTIYAAMKRRQLTKINGVKIPEKYTSSAEIFKLLRYQNSIFYRIKKKIRLLPYVLSKK